MIVLVEILRESLEVADYTCHLIVGHVSFIFEVLDLLTHQFAFYMEFILKFQKLVRE